jgi:type IV fimbrial biogenesis protein FimT
MTSRAQRPGGGRFSSGRGFTLVELLVALLVLVVLITFGVPSFNKAMLGARLSGFSSQLFGAMQQARSEALKRNAAVTLCASEDGTACTTGTDWEIGWIVLSDATVLHVQGALPDGFKVVEASGAESLTFSPTLTETTPASFKICRDSPDGTQERIVTLTAMGTANVVRTEAGTCP